MTTDLVMAVAAVAQVVLAAVLAGITWRYVVLTRKLVDETQRSRRPRIYVDLEHLGQFNCSIRVTNQGNESARDISFRVKRDFGWPDAKWPDMLLGTQRWVTDGLRLLTPGATLKYHLHPDYAHAERNLGSEDLRAELSITYADTATGAVYEDASVLDITPVALQSKRGDGGALEKIAQTLESQDMRQRMLDTSRSFRPDGVPCPLCGQRIPSGATVCHHCLRDLPSHSDEGTDSAVDEVE